MRYTDDGYISTEVALPKEGSRVEYKWHEHLHGEPGSATFDGMMFIFDSPYQSYNMQPEWLFHASLGKRNGYWRYLDTPGKEKRDSGHSGAFCGHLGELRDSLNNLGAALEGTIEEIDKILESEKPANSSDKLAQEGWISGDVRKPKNYKIGYELMKDGVIISDPVQGGWSQENGWTLGFPVEYRNLNGEDAAGVYWRPMANLWRKSTPENLAKLAPQEVVEVKTKDGKIYKGFVGVRGRWHFGKPSCYYMDGGTANDGKGDCVTRSTDGTWFRKVKSPRK